LQDAQIVKATGLVNATNIHQALFDHVGVVRF
jgi:hypothetical protein